jgi:hypothetical protein
VLAIPTESTASLTALLRHFETRQISTSGAAGQTAGTQERSAANQVDPALIATLWSRRPSLAEQHHPDGMGYEGSHPTSSSPPDRLPEATSGHPVSPTVTGVQCRPRHVAMLPVLCALTGGEPDQPQADRDPVIGAPSDDI